LAKEGTWNTFKKVGSLRNLKIGNEDTLILLKLRETYLQLNCFDKEFDIDINVIQITNLKTI